MPGVAPNGAMIFFPTNPDLADMLGRTDLDFENFYFILFFGIPNSHISRFPDFQKSGLGQAWAGLGPGLGRAGPGMGRAELGLVRLGLVPGWPLGWDGGRLG